MSDNIKIALQKIHNEIIDLARQFNRNLDEILILAVSKNQSLDKIEAAINAGQTHFGENYLQEALEKIALFTNTNITWHFIGHIQSNKCKLIAQHFAWVHGVDRLKIAQQLNQYRSNKLPPLNVCIQVNISGENSKSGLQHFDEIQSLAEAIQTLPHLQLRGLMAMASTGANYEQQRREFHLLRNFYDQLKQKITNCDTLSMGMSQDYRAAIAEGATLLRIGSLIFGKRES